MLPILFAYVVSDPWEFYRIFARRKCGSRIIFPCHSFEENWDLVDQFNYSIGIYFQLKYCECYRWSQWFQIANNWINFRLWKAHFRISYLAKSIVWCMYQWGPHFISEIDFVFFIVVSVLLLLDESNRNYSLTYCAQAK